MKNNKLIYGIIGVIIVFSSCNRVQVTNSTDEQAVPVRMVKDTIVNPTTSGRVLFRKIIDYKVVSKGTFDDLAIAVKNEMKNGWQPLGGTDQYLSGQINQTLVMYEDQKK